MARPKSAKRKLAALIVGITVMPGALGLLSMSGIAQSPSYSIQEFPAGGGLSIPWDLTVGKDNAIWFTEAAANNIRRITLDGELDPHEFVVPTPASAPVGITTDPEGNLWFTEAATDKIGKMTPSGDFEEWSIPTTGGEPYDIAYAPNGKVWFAEMWGWEDSKGKIGRLDPATGDVREWDWDGDGDPKSITIDHDGNPWFTMRYNKVGRINPDETVTKFSVPNSGSPWGMTTGQDGNIWFTGYGARVNRIKTDGTGLTTITIPKAPPHFSGPLSVSITNGPDGTMWVASEHSTHNYVTQVLVGPGGTITIGEQIEIPTYNSQAGNIITGPDGNVWFTERTGGKIGKVVGFPGPTLSTVEPPQGPTAGGTSVTIKGTKLANTASIKFGDSASITCGEGNAACHPDESHPNERLKVISPAHNASGQVISVKVPGWDPVTGPNFSYQPPHVDGIDVTSGPATGGTKVNLTGTLFQGGSVKFGGAKAQTSFSSTDPNNLGPMSAVATTPSHPPGAVEVEVGTPPDPNINKGLGPQQFTYFPAISAISPPSGKPEGGEQVTIFGKGFLGATTITFGNEAPISIPASVKDEEIVLRTPAHTVAESVIVTVSGYLNGPAAGMSSIAAEIGSNLFTYKQGLVRGTGSPNNPAGLSSQDSGLQPTTTSTGGGTGGSSAISPSPGNLFAPGSGFVSNVSVNSVPGAGFVQSSVGGQGLAPGAATTTTGPPSPITAKSGIPAESGMPIAQPGHQGATTAAAGIVEAIPEAAPRYLMVETQSARGMPWLSFTVVAVMFSVCFFELIERRKAWCRLSKASIGAAY